MTPDEKLAAILAAVQTDPGNRGLARDPHDNLFTATAGDFQRACSRLSEDSGAGVALFTGFYILKGNPPASETDGPLGSIFLATALASLHYNCILATDVMTMQAINIGLQERDVWHSQLPNSDSNNKYGWPRVITITVPPSGHPWHVYVALDWRFLHDPSRIRHAISIERVGPSHKDGKPYSMRGNDLSDVTAPIHYLIEECRRVTPPVHTVGIGDGGNELGMGKISWATIARNIPKGEQIACRVPTDHLIVAGVSNWGAYALAAGLFVLKGVTPPPDLFDPDREREILEVMVKTGPLVDGVTGEQTATVDGLTWDEYVKPLIQIREILEA